MRGETGKGVDLVEDEAFDKAVDPREPEADGAELSVLIDVEIRTLRCELAIDQPATLTRPDRYRRLD